jgi:hypothetical protein
MKNKERIAILESEISRLKVANRTANERLTTIEAKLGIESPKPPCSAITDALNNLVVKVERQRIKPEAPECVANKCAPNEGHLKEHIDNFFNRSYDAYMESIEKKIVAEFGEDADISKKFKVMRNTYDLRNLKASIKPDFIPDWKDAPEDAVCVAMDEDGHWFWWDKTPTCNDKSWVIMDDIERTSSGKATNAHLLPTDYWKSTLMMRPDANAGDWATAPDWAMYKAMDKNGVWNWFSGEPYIEGSEDKNEVWNWFGDEPYIEGSEWVHRECEDKYKLIPNHPPSDKPWNETLEANPDAVIKLNKALHDLLINHAPNVRSFEPDYTHLLPEGYEFCQEADAEKWVKVEKIGFFNENKIGCLRTNKPAIPKILDCYRPIRPIQYKMTTHEITTAIPDPYMPDWSKAPEGTVAHAWDMDGKGFWCMTNIEEGTHWGLRYESSHLALLPDLDWKQSLRVKPSK